MVAFRLCEVPNTCPKLTTKKLLWRCFLQTSRNSAHFFNQPEVRRTVVMCLQVRICRTINGYNTDMRLVLLTSWQQCAPPGAEREKADVEGVVCCFANEVMDAVWPSLDWTPEEHALFWFEYEITYHRAVRMFFLQFLTWENIPLNQLSRRKPWWWYNGWFKC